MDDDDDEVTEMVDFEATRVDGVKAGANGFGFIVAKAAQEPGGTPRLLIRLRADR